MAPKPEDTLRKVTLNLFEADCAVLETAFGHGWTQRIREWVHEKTWTNRSRQPRTLGDLSDE